MILGLKRAVGHDGGHENSPPFFQNKKSLRKEAYLFR